MFRIDAKNLCWVNGDSDNAADLCLHGDVTVQIGSETFEHYGTVSATGLFLLRTLTENHIAGSYFMLPCCGHFLIACDELDSVEIAGCLNGVNFFVEHVNDHIKITSQSGCMVYVSMSDYAKDVFKFADKIEEYYKKCSPKNLNLCDKFDRNGYIAFWNEWKRLRR